MQLNPSAIRSAPGAGERLGSLGLVWRSELSVGAGLRKGFEDQWKL